METNHCQLSNATIAHCAHHTMAAAWTVPVKEFAIPGYDGIACSTCKRETYADDLFSLLVEFAHFIVAFVRNATIEKSTGGNYAPAVSTCGWE